MQSADLTTTLAEDPYASRCSDVPEFRERRDPVLYGDPSPEAPLNPSLAQSFAENGFLLLDGLFGKDEIARLQKEMERLRLELKRDGRDEVITEPNSGEVRSVFAIHEVSPVFGALARDRRLADVARFILGDDVYIHQSRLNYKPGFVGKEFYWHSDFETWHLEDGMPRMRAISMSISLSENYAFNGPLMLIPGSHLVYLTCVGETPDDHYKQSLKKQEYGVPDNDSLTRLVQDGGIEMPIGDVGSIVLFDCNTMHGSNGNITPFQRSNAFIVYNAVSNRLVEPYAGTKPRPPFVASREFTPLR